MQETPTVTTKPTETDTLSDSDLEPLADETAHKAQRVVAAYATDADECRTLLSMLGIGPSSRLD